MSRAGRALGVRARRPASIGALLLFVAALAIAPAYARADGGIGLAPVSVGGIDPAVGGMLLEAVAPGAAAGGDVVVSNGTAQAVGLLVYVAEGLTGQTSGVVYGDAPSAASWVTTSTDALTLAPGAQQTIAFAVHAPPDAGSGDHVSAIVVSQAATAAPRGAGFAVGEVVRSVVPVDVVVAGAAAPQVGVGAPTLGTLAGTALPAAIIRISNTGSRMCSPKLSVTVDGVTVQRQIDTILPGDAIDYPFSWPHALSDGDHHVSVVATDCGSSRSASGDAPYRPAGGGPAPTAPAAPRQPVAPAATAGGSGAADGQHRVARSVKAHHRHRHHGRHVSSRHASAAPVSGGVKGSTRPRHTPPRRGGDPVARAIAAVAKAALNNAAFPLVLLVVLAAFVLLQNAIDRRDPKLALAPVYAEPDLPFDGDPLAPPA